MAKDWPYAKLAEEAKKHCGPEQYVETLENYGVQKGIGAMIPVCAGCVWVQRRKKEARRFLGQQSLRVFSGLYAFHEKELGFFLAVIQGAPCSE